MLKMTSIVFIYSCFLIAGYAHQVELKSHTVSTPPAIDGKLIEDCWKKAIPAADFKQLRTGILAKEKTEVYVLNDDSYLYFGFKCQEPEMEKIKTLAAANKNMFKYGEGENIEIFLCPFNHKKNILQFIVNTNGTSDAYFFSSMQTARLPWKSAVFLGDDFFSVEVAIPFDILHLFPGAEKDWSINLCRARMISGGRDEPFSSWSPVTTSFREPSTWGKLFIIENFSRYFYDLKTNVDIVTGIPWIATIKNLTGKDSMIEIDASLYRADGKNISSKHSTLIQVNELKTIKLGIFSKEDANAIMNISVKEKDTGKTVYRGAAQSIDVTKPVDETSDIVLDYFTIENQKSWIYSVIKWDPAGVIRIPAETYTPEFLTSKVKDYFEEGEGSVKIAFSSAAIHNFQDCYITVIKNINLENVNLENKYLVFDIFKETGGGMFDVRILLKNNTTVIVSKQKNKSKDKILLDFTGLKQFRLPISSVKNEEIKSLEFVFHGDFVLYLSNLKISNSGICDSRKREQSKENQLPSVDVTSSI